MVRSAGELVDTVNYKAIVDKVNRCYDLFMSDDIGRLIGDVSHRFRQRLRTSAVLDELGLAPVQAELLVWIGRTDHATAKAFVEGTGRDRGQVARLVTLLDNAGLLHRRPSQQDGRIQYLELTERGRAYAHRLRANRARIAAESLRGIGEEDQAALARILAVVRDNLREG